MAGEPHAGMLFEDRKKLEDQWHALHSTGLRLFQNRRLMEAAHAFSHSLAIARRVYPGGHANLAWNLNNLAQLLQAQNRHADAEPLFRESLAMRRQLHPGDHIDTSGSLHGLGSTLLGMNRFEEAEQALRESLEMRGRLIDAPDATMATTLNNLGAVLVKLRKYDDAKLFLMQSLEMRRRLYPTERFPTGHVAIARSLDVVGQLFAELGQYAEAEPLFRESLTMQRRFLTGDDAFLANTINNLGGALQNQNQPGAAEPWFRDALAMQRRLFNAGSPELAMTLNNLACSLRSRGRSDEAEPLVREAVRLKPDFADAYSNLGVVLFQQGRLADAMKCFDEALRLNPDDAHAHLNRSFLRLRTGDFERGWPEYEYRFQTPRSHRPTGPAPDWDGTELNGRTLLLQSEQGLGDAVHFMRFAALVPRGNGGTIILECADELKELARTCPGIDHIAVRGQPLPPCDVCLPLLSVPRVLRTTLETIPGKVPYLSAETSRIEHWKRELASLPGRRVGIVWQGSSQKAGDAMRSVPFSRFAALAEAPGVSLCSLQKGYAIDRSFEYTIGSGRVYDFGARTGTSLADTAALVEALDLVVTVDTAVAHVAGALGAPVWVTLPFAADWRWFTNREDSPWYPTMRLFRQPKPNDWDGVFAEVAAALGQWGKSTQATEHDDCQGTTCWSCGKRDAFG